MPAKPPKPWTLFNLRIPSSDLAQLEKLSHQQGIKRGALAVQALGRGLELLQADPSAPVAPQAPIGAVSPPGPQKSSPIPLFSAFAESNDPAETLQKLAAAMPQGITGLCTVRIEVLRARLDF